MKKFTLTLLLLCSLCSFAQTGFIEVEVTDTVWMKPVSYDYNVVLNSDRFNMYASYPDSVSVDAEDYIPLPKEADITLADLKAYLTQKGYTAKTIEYQGTNIFRNNEAEGFTVTVTSTGQLEKLKADIDGLDYAIGIMGTVNYGDSSAYDARIYKKLLEAARKKADVIAGFSSQKLGRVIEVREPSKTPDTFMDYMIQLRMSMGETEKLNRGANNNLYGELTKTVMVKFSAQ